MKTTRVFRVALGAFLAVLALAVNPPLAMAQAPAADSAAVLLDAADDFERRGELDVAVALYDFIVQRFPNTPAASSARLRLADARNRASAGSGETELKVWSALYGLWLGIAIPAAADADGSEAYGVGLLLGGPAGYLAGRSLARRRALTLGQARAVTWGGTWGTWQGMGWAFALDFGGDQYCSGDVCFEEEESSQAVFVSMIAGGAAGLVVGSLISRREISDGLATTVNLGSLWGTWFGVATSVLLDLEGDELLTGTLIGGNVGLVGSALAGRGWNLSRSRARLISIAGVLGGLSGAGVDLLIQPDDEKVAIAIPLAGSLIGLGIGAASTRNARGAADGAREADPFAPSALLNWSHDGLSLGAPLPSLARLPSDRRADRPSWTLPLLRVRF